MVDQGNRNQEGREEPVTNKIDELRDYYDTNDTSEEMERGQWVADPGKTAETAMSGFNTRFPTPVLNDVRALAKVRGMSTGEWIREVVEAAVAREKAGTEMVPVSVLLAAVEEYQHRRAS
jgi:predicted DNA-binding protein